MDIKPSTGKSIVKKFKQYGAESFYDMRSEDISPMVEFEK